jgi:hypothetical protein
MQIKASSLDLGVSFLASLIGLKDSFRVGWVVSFVAFDYYFLFIVGGARNELGSTLLTLILTPLKANTQSVCGFDCSLLNLTQVLLNNFFAQNSFLKTCSQISNLLL